MRIIFAILCCIALFAAPAVAETPAPDAVDWEALAALLTGGYPALPDDPQTGEWYAVAPEGAVCADGTPWHGLIRLGTANRVIVFFFGGGVSLTPETSRIEDGWFFFPNIALQDAIVAGGIFSSDAQNPFADWTMLAVEYASGDFHTGTGEVTYTAADGTPRTVYHNGYNNYSGFMDAVAPQLGTPDALVVTGSSAGGFATALLTDDVMSRFPDTKNVTACVDSALLLYDGWQNTARDVWHAPDEIASRLTTDDIVLDSLRALHEKRGGDVKILFTCSTRDNALQSYQAFIDAGCTGALPPASLERSDRMEAMLRDFVGELERDIPGAGMYIFTCGEAPDTSTQHMILPSNPFDAHSGGVSVADWMMDAVQGNVQSYGLELLGIE